MTWNWTQPEWPNFRHDAAALQSLEQRFLLSSGEVIGAVRHIQPEQRDLLRIELLSDEAIKTSAIEGEFLDRLSGVVCGSGRNPTLSFWNDRDSCDSRQPVAFQVAGGKIP